MERRSFPLALAGSLVGLAWTKALMASDPLAHPPPSQSYASAAGDYRLEIRLRPGAEPHRAGSTASLFDLRSSTRRLLWTRELAHRPRPRFAVVGDQGQVVLLDEWLNLRSDLAVMLIDHANRDVAVHSLEAVRQALDVPVSAFAPHARHGVWIQGPPTLSPDRHAVEVAAADRILLISLRNGALSRR